MRLMVDVGGGCANLMNEEMRDLSCQRLQVDEIWSFVGKKQAQLKPGDDRSRLGDQWTFVALDPDTKLVPTHLVGKRTRKNAVAFMDDFSGRLDNRVQISSDALSSYVDAVERAFCADVDYGQVVKLTWPKLFASPALKPSVTSTPRRMPKCRNLNRLTLD